MYCRRRYYYEYELMRDPKTVAAALSTGSSIHALLAGVAKAEGLDVGSDMYDVVYAYLEHHPLPANIVSAEEPYYVQLLEADEENEAVWLRCTFDLIYMRGKDWYVVRDYKSFSKASDHNVDLDFQGRLYIATAMRYFKTDRVEFEYEYIRTTPPYVAHNKKGDKWTPEECYDRVPVIISTREADVMWAEAQDVARDLLRAKKEGRFYREPRRGFMNGCEACPMRQLCMADLQQGGLDDQTLELLSNPREPDTNIPKELK